MSNAAPESSNPRRRSSDAVIPVSPNALEADSSIYKEIAINAQDVLRVGFVQMMRVDWEAQMVNVVTASDLYEITFQKALEQIREVFPKWDTTRIQYPTSVGAWARTVYFEGKTVVIPTLDRAGDRWWSRARQPELHATFADFLGRLTQNRRKFR
jgi:hypothetical protein